MTDKFEKVIEKQTQRQINLKEQRENFIQENQTKQITVKIFPNTHKALKLLAASKDTTLEKVATFIIEDNVRDFDIVKFVEDAFNDVETFETGYNWLQRLDIDNSTYDLNDKLLNKGNPRKRINVKVNLDTHRKLRVISAIQDRSLDNLVSSIIEYNMGEDNQIDTSKLMEEILKSIED
ncbi:hypothetical protein [uncultured Methanobrevibacter sp.]|uniref:hypothetical protein n=1 Tax=uncultured Methanobrevibacter sp. TaxID=253161 RepID=UPI0025EE0BD0|nr:hypothetical protein [uncultured Methanobrevibacter sp.]